MRPDCIDITIARVTVSMNWLPRNIPVEAIMRFDDKLQVVFKSAVGIAFEI